MFSGEIDFQFIDSTVGTALLQDGKVRGLAVTSGQRVPGVDLPTMRGGRHAEFDIRAVWGVLLPAGAPPPIVARLESWFAESADGRPPGNICQYSCWRVSGRRPGIGRFHSEEIKKWEELRGWRRSSRNKARDDIASRPTVALV